MRDSTITNAMTVDVEGNFHVYAFQHVQRRLERLLRDFRWDRMHRVFPGRTVTVSLDVNNVVVVGGSA